MWRARCYERQSAWAVVSSNYYGNYRRANRYWHGSIQVVSDFNPLKPTYINISSRIYRHITLMVVRCSATRADAAVTLRRPIKYRYLHHPRQCHVCRPTRRPCYVCCNIGVLQKAMLVGHEFADATKSALITLLRQLRLDYRATLRVTLCSVHKACP